MKSVADSVGDSLADSAAQQAKECIDSGVQACNALSENVQAAGKRVDGYVRKNPWLMVGAAAGIGMLVGMLIRRP